MATPTIANTGTLSNMILITGNSGIQYNIPKGIAVFVNSSNESVQRIDLQYGVHEINLIFDNSTLLNAFVTTMRSLY